MRIEKKEEMGCGLSVRETKVDRDRVLLMMLASVWVELGSMTAFDASVVDEQLLQLEGFLA